MLVVDQKYFVTGGMNLTNWMLPIKEMPKKGLQAETHRDLDIIGKGSVAKRLKQEFDISWNKWKQRTGKKKNPSLDHGTPTITSPCDIKEFEVTDKLKPETTTVVASTPSQGKVNQCERAYLNMINSAQKTITIANMAFNNKRIINALNRSIKRGVNIKVLSNGDAKGATLSTKLIGSRNRTHYAKLFKAAKTKGAGQFKLFENRVKGHLLHAKAIVVDPDSDNPYFAIGSFNIDTKSSRCDDETLLVMNSNKVAQAAKKCIETNYEPYMTEFKESSLKKFRFKATLLKGHLLNTLFKYIF